MNSQQDYTPPYSLSSEQAVLGAILFDPDGIAQVADSLLADDFYRNAHNLIYQAMLELFKHGEPVDVVTVGEMLNDKECLDAAGGRVYVMDLAMNVATAENIRHYANIVKDFAIRRKLIEAAELVIVDAHQKSGAETLENAQTNIMQIATAAEETAELTTKEVANLALDTLVTQIQSGSKVVGIPSGFHELDNLITGLNKANFIILAARPAMGKTGLAVNIAANIAIRQGLPVLYYTQEMTEEQMMQRLIIAEAETKTDIQRLAQAADSIPEHFKFIRKPGLSIPQLRASIIKNRLKMGEVGLVVVDYLQLLSSSKQGLFEQVSDISTGLKNLSLEFKLPFLVLSQLSREVEKRQDKTPQLSDLRQSGSLEQDADSVLFIYRDEYYNKESERPGIADIVIAKNRHGPIGQVELIFRAPIVKFLNPFHSGNTNGF